MRSKDARPTLTMAALSVLVVVFLSLTATAQTLSNSPSEYFGGIDNDVYLDWWSKSFSKYTSSLFLPSNFDSDVGAAVHWNIVGDSINLAVAARATGWLGLGLSENGGMVRGRGRGDSKGQ
jgi:hypothetical protein